MKIFLKYMLLILVKLIGQKRIKSVIPAIVRFAGLDLLILAYNDLGILKCENAMASGEYFLINKILKKNFENIAKPVIFDVGGNVGNYSLMLTKGLPHALIYAFEPNGNTYNQLLANVGNLVNCINLGMGVEEKSEKIFTYSNNLTSSHASIYGGVFRTFHRAENVVELDIQMTTLDLFCEREKLTCIDFLKIDTEGNELNVLKGGTKMLSEMKVNIIQFEFGECDVYSRVFLLDFYAMLPDYNIYRLDSERLIPLYQYDSTNEIFRYQNFIAVRKDFPFQDWQTNLPCC